MKYVVELLGIVLIEVLVLSVVDVFVGNNSKRLDEVVVASFVEVHVEFVAKLDVELVSEVEVDSAPSKP